MTLFWIAIGTLALAAPHIATVGTDGAMAWAGLPFPAECAGVALAIVCVYLADIPKRLRGILGPAALVSVCAMLILEAVASLLGEGSLGGLAWGAVDEALHFLSAAFWLLLARDRLQDAAMRQDATRRQDPLLRAFEHILLFVSGATWYLTTAAIRYALPARGPAHEMLLWACAILWAALVAVLLATSPCTAKAYAARAAAPALGILLANRAWALALAAGAARPAAGNFAGALLAAPVLAFAALVVAWINEKPEEAEEQTVGETSAQKTESALQTTSPAARLPLHLIPGYQTLSNREREVLLKTLDGATSQEIAADLGISGTTVRTYRARAYEKMNVVGMPELLAAVRVSVEQPFPMPELPDPELSPAVLTPPERITPKLASALAAFVVVFAVLMLRKVPSLAAQELVMCATCAAFSAVALIRLHRADDTCSPKATIAAALLGMAAAIAVSALLLGPGAYLARRAILSMATLTAIFWLTYRLWPLEGSSPFVALAAFSLVGFACSPAGVRAQALVHSTVPFIVVAALALVAALILKGMVNDVEVLIAAIALKGDERVLAYLQGRGINDVMAQVALLTARGFPLKGIADTVHISPSTVGKYRERLHKALGVKNKEGLTSLLEREAGLVVVATESAKEGPDDE